MKRFKRLLAVASAVVGIALTGALAAQANQQATPDAQLSTVEDYAYPGADQIFATYGVRLISGDGHIMAADCAIPSSGPLGLIEVHTTEHIGPDQKGLICFKVIGSSGSLSLQVPKAYEIRGDGRVPGAGHKVRAELTTEAGEHTTVDVNPSGSTPVGIGTGSNTPTTLLKLIASL
ncbi:hypothetical protein [Goodfellowiella coeruleoviolacea]|uniref:hypothetical protein n=1 Tax=Goodfellowiella coeruleoviolacea TaxID=334858 RepID=UPI0020A2EC1B|nr:hypothetical protein [Goodfellowiella coeruleoviolacea]